MSDDIRADDADIDALMGAVVGNNGKVIEFPTPRATKTKRNKAAIVESLSVELAAQLEASDVKPLIDPRTVPVRFSNLKHMARSALHYLDAVQLGREDTLAMRLGRGAHAMVLGQPVEFTPHRRGTKAWKACVKKFPADTEILSAKEWAKAKGINDAIRRHPVASRLLFEGTIIEQTVEWEWLGRKCTSRPDARLPGVHVTDLKTTQCADPDRFRYDAINRGYHAQLAFYGLAEKYITGKEPDDLYAAAVESKRPYDVVVLRLTDEARQQGEKMCRAWFERLLTCEASNHWAGYTDAIVALDARGDGDPDSAIDIDDLPDDHELFA